MQTPITYFLIKGLFVSFLIINTHYALANSWIRAWSTAPSDAGGGIVLFPHTTVRQTISTYADGQAARLRLSNVLGSENIKLTNIKFAIEQNKAQSIAGSSKELTFLGKKEVTIPAGGYAVSDPFDFPIKTLERYHVSFTLLTRVTDATRHAIASEMPYVSYFTRPNDESGQFFLPFLAPLTQSWILLDSLEVEKSTEKEQKIVMIVGDSISDGAGNTLNTFVVNPLNYESSNIGTTTRYSDFLAKRLLQSGNSSTVVLNAGISGNRVGANQPAIASFAGHSLLSRLNRDVIHIPNVQTVILLEGINDLGLPKQPDANQLIKNLNIAVTRLKTAQKKVLLGTLTPAKGVPLFYRVITGTHAGSQAVENARQEVNKWIRAQKISDGVVDFDKCLRDPINKSQLNPLFNSGDFLHPNNLGRKAMADCIDLSSL